MMETPSFTATPHFQSLRAIIMNKDDIQETFQSFDKTGGNTISSADIESFLFACGLNPLRADVNKLVADLGSNPVTFEQAYACYQSMSKKQESISKETLYEIFKPFDRDGNGHVMVADFRQVVSSLGDKLSEEEVNQILSYVEVHNNGTIIYEDLVKWVLSG